MIVVAASALMALLLREPGHDVVAQSISEAAVSAVNLSEVLARMGLERIASRPLIAKLTLLGLTVVEFDEPQAIIVGEIRESARRAGVGLADCCCLALALHSTLPVLTADRVWKTLGFDLDIRLIR